MLYIYTSIYIYIYSDSERQTDRQRERERERESQRLKAENVSKKVQQKIKEVKIFFTLTRMMLPPQI